MADVKVTQAHSMSTDDAKKAVASFEEMLTKYNVKTNWKGNKADLKGTGVSGSINVTDSSVAVVVKLGLLAKAAGVDADRLKSSIEKRLSAALA